MGLPQAACITAIALSTMVLPAAIAGARAQAEQTPSSTYEVVPQADGTLRIVPKAGVSSPNVASGTQGATGAAKPTDLTDLSAAFKDQDWFVKVSPKGDPTALYSLPSGETPSATIFSNLRPGESVMKVGAPAWLGTMALSQEQIRAVLELLLANAQGAVCGMPSRPSNFGTQVDVSAGIGIQGRIAFAQWDTKDLCRQP